ncbi:DNA cytosine methyltransferase [Flagellimonas sp.]|uniref:DNA cytosine methyltransferase n=1 Tax=Flagellimonas sp. TaxID=2058762 RepID=UPI003AB3E88F
MLHRCFFKVMGLEVFLKNCGNLMIKKEKRPLVVSLFTGGGGLDLGLDAAGFHTVFASDIDAHSCSTLKMGREAAAAMGKPILEGAHIEQSDVRDLSGKYILDTIGLKPGELGMLAGGPPCQAFSVFGRRKGKEDPRGMLAWEFIRLIGELQPKCFLFENVYGLLTIEKGRVFEELCKELREPASGIGYTIKVFRLNAADFGVPQFRDRVFVLGMKDDVDFDQVNPLCGDFSGDLFGECILPYRTVANGLHGLPPMGTSSIGNHTGRKHSQRIIDRYASMAPGARDKHTRINKLDLKRPSFTIIVGSDAGGGKGHIHPLEPREVTPRESARMQTFPDWWTFSGTGRHPIRQVGNAVPPLLSGVLAKHILQKCFGRKDRSYREIVEYLSATHLFSEEELSILDRMEFGHFSKVSTLSQAQPSIV